MLMLREMLEEAPLAQLGQRQRLEKKGAQT